MNNCIVCGSNLIVKIHDHFPGYIKGKDYEVFSCKNCDSHFIDPQKIDNALYSIIYSNGNILGYDRYLKYASEILNQSDALKYLTSKESTYYPVFKFLRNKRNLKILELGCGYGYLTYAIRREGHDCFGIDLSQQAIDFALSNYGKYFTCASIEEFIKSNKQSYDLVIATEVVEHLSNISDFLEETKKILAPSGQILLTTPNKDFTKKDFVWLTDLPPVHVTWLGKKSFLVLGSQKQFEVSFISFRNYYPKNENRFIKYLRFQRDIDPKPVFNDNGIPIIKSEETRFPFLRNIIKWLVHGFPPLRLFSNILFNYLYPDDNTLGVILKPIETNRRLD